MTVVHINDDAAFDQAIKNANEKLILIDFFANWCPPCRQMSPIIDRFARDYSPPAIFLKVDVDVCRVTVQTFAIQAMPTFLFMKNGKILDRIVGADERALEQKLRQHLDQTSSVDDYPANIDESERQFFKEILNYAERSIIYEDPIRQTLAASVIPIERIEADIRARAPADSLSSAQFADQLLLGLLRWFKVDFFSWVDAPKCPQCNAVTVRLNEHWMPTAEELAGDAQRIEAYRCDACQLPVRFARYNDPAKLIETRQGRCGEWANCFTLCARAIGFETRFVHDQTDHVWTEVWSVANNRWLHCDPCENVCDRPLLYERGWGKQLTYVLAFSIDEVVDVSWRYSINHRAMLARRKRCREHRLITFIRQLNDRKRETMSAERRNELLQRQLNELIEFISPKLQIRDGTEAGRISGALDWRMERGEVGAQQQIAVELVPNAREIETKRMEIIYRCGIDEYERVVTGTKAKGWSTWTNSQRNMQRKEEYDWKMCYLARNSSNEDAVVSWKIDLTQMADRVQSVKIFVQRSVFHSGTVRIQCCIGDQCLIMAEDKLRISEEDLKDCAHVELTCTLSGGDGDNAWQHAQLFRTAINSNERTFGMRIDFK